MSTSDSMSTTSSHHEPGLAHKGLICTNCYDETMNLKVVGACKHAFCLFCVSTHLEDHPGGPSVFACPTCKIECPLPAQGIEGLVDVTGSDSDDEAADSGVPESTTESDKSFGDSSFESTDCRVCHHRGVSSTAENRCEDCDDLFLCENCSNVHNRKFESAGHVLSSLHAITEVIQDSGICLAHHERLKSYCRTCGQPVCHVCVMLDHVEHDTEKIGELVRTEVTDIRKKIDEGKQKIRHLDHAQKDVMATKEAILDWKQTMLRRIEKKAEDLITEITKQRDAMKQKIRGGFDIAEMSATILEIPEIQKTIKNCIGKSELLLTETTTHPIFYDRLVDAKEDLEIVLETEMETAHWERLKQPFPSFIPSEQKIELGTVANTTFTSAETVPGMSWYFKTKEDHVISSVVNLGIDCFAIAAPSSPVRRTDAIEIRHSQRSVKLMKDKVHPAIDMAHTPGGKLATLTYGQTQGQGCIRLFDASRGYLRSIEGFAMDIPLSLSVNIQGQYMVLDQDAQAGPRISAVNAAGVIDRAHPLRNDKHGIRDISRVTCGGQFIYIMGENGVAAYAFNNGRFELKSSFTGHTWLHGLDDIAATVTDDVYLAYRHKIGRRREVFVARILKNGGLPDWSYEPHLINEKVKKRTRLDVKNNTLILSDGNHYAIYMLK
ncbi:uncharacterized protein LOC135500651 [Lineus longissimus]|uniref:uncharacterized protein LOC135500651 n=1 Tax=Lineus longissimus TaxID=88925 RepID=UPI00315D8B8A